MRLLPITEGAWRSIRVDVASAKPATPIIDSFPSDISVFSSSNENMRSVRALEGKWNAVRGAAAGLRRGARPAVHARGRARSAREGSGVARERLGGARAVLPAAARQTRGRERRARAALPRGADALRGRGADVHGGGDRVTFTNARGSATTSRYFRAIFGLGTPLVKTRDGYISDNVAMCASTALLLLDVELAEQREVVGRRDGAGQRDLPAGVLERHDLHERRRSQPGGFSIWAELCVSAAEVVVYRDEAVHFAVWQRVEVAGKDGRGGRIQCASKRLDCAQHSARLQELHVFLHRIPKQVRCRDYKIQWRIDVLEVNDCADAAPLGGPRKQLVVDVCSPKDRDSLPPANTSSKITPSTHLPALQPTAPAAYQVLGPILPPELAGLARLKPTRVLNPHERELDEAIWNAFRADDFAPFFQIYHGRRPELRVDPVAFQRPADGSTILMAAALHGRSDVIEVLLRSGTASVLQRDWEGATAAVFAKRGGHANVETALLACEEAEQEKDYVYDVYCVDISASEQQDRAHDTATTSEGASEQASVSGVPVVSVSSEVHRWLSEEPSDEVEEYMLESDIDSNEEVDGLSEDSNDEDHVANDYPDEESSDESLADSEDLDEVRASAGGSFAIGARRRWLNTEDDYTERDDFDY
ncbi:hypothetical protein ON010_g6729 [Phytophthora cinnamomi]|nr:hypothetical protein ON010_g6729 [Phytophthora cinnamomi]